MMRRSIRQRLAVRCLLTTTKGELCVHPALYQLAIHSVILPASLSPRACCLPARAAQFKDYGILSEGLAADIVKGRLPPLRLASLVSSRSPSYNVPTCLRRKPLYPGSVPP